ncbi:hypothetical protein L1887_05165 [Cichorium endivia]|nr:hypothetical protein L1887_05165 [Cichorium endivia]
MSPRPYHMILYRFPLSISQKYDIFQHLLSLSPSPGKSFPPSSFQFIDFQMSWCIIRYKPFQFLLEYLHF